LLLSLTRPVSWVPPTERGPPTRRQTPKVLIMRGDNPKAIGEHLATQLPRLRALG